MASIERMWKSILRDIMIKGHTHHKDDAEIKEILNISGWIDSPMSEFTQIKLGKERYLEFLKDGVFDIEGYNLKGTALAQYVSDFDNIEQIKLDSDDSFVYTYPERLQGYLTIDKFGTWGYKNQIEIMVKRLKENLGTNRAVCVLYQTGLDDKEEHIPCLNWLQALVRDNSLYLSVMFRSNDIYNAFPSNMFFISYVGLTIEEKLQEQYPALVFDGIYYQCSSAHYYTNEVYDSLIEKILK